MTRIRRPSQQTMEVMMAIAQRDGSWAYGYDIARETGLKSGSLYPILARLAELGWLTATWETVAIPGRPARHLYRLTPAGKAALREAASSKDSSLAYGTPRTVEA
jgi:PadR family transcriptional regulator PadR